MSVTVERLVADIEADPSKAIAGLEAFDAAVAASTRDHSTEIDLDFDGVFSDLFSLEAELDATTRDRTVNIDIDRRGSAAISTAMAGVTAGLGAVTTAAGGAQGALSGVMQAGSQVGDVFEGVTENLGGGGGLASSLGTIVGGAAGVLQVFGPMLVMGLAIGSVLPGAFAAAAAGAGILLGALAPLVGLLGIIPVGIGAIGLAAGALFAAFGPVIGAVTAYGAMTKAAAADSEALAQKQRALADAQRAVQDALYGVAQAEKSVTAARKNLSKAPLEAAEAIEDAHFRAAQAALDEKRAILSLQEAQKNLSAIQNEVARSGLKVTQQTDEFTGKIYDVAVSSDDAALSAKDLRSAQLALAQAQLDVAKSKDANGDAQRSLNEYEKKGIKNSDIMVSAREQMANAEHQLAMAQRSVADALRNQAEAQAALNTQIKSGSAAMQEWQAALAKLSPAGQSFVRFLTGEFMPAFGGISKLVQEEMLPGIEEGLRAFLSTTDEIGTELGIIGKMMGDTFSDFMNFWTKPKQQSALTDMFGALNEVMGASLSIVRPLSRMLVAITTAAAPMVESIMGAMGKQFDVWSDWLESPAGQKGMTQFFEDAAHFAGLWLNVMGGLGGVLKGVTRAAKPLAEKWLVSMADSLDSMSEFLNSAEGQEMLKQFFLDSVPALEQLGGLITDIFDLLFNSSKGGEDTGFYKALVAMREVIPDIKDLFETLDGSNFMGQAIDAMGGFVDVVNLVPWGPLSDVIDGMMWLHDKWEDFRKFLSQFPFLNETLTAILNPAAALFDLLGFIMEAISRISFEGMAESFLQMWLTIKTKWNEMIDFFDRKWQLIEDGAELAVEGIKEWFGGLYDWFDEHVIQPIVELWDNTIGRLKMPDLPDLNAGEGTGVIPDITPWDGVVPHFYSGGPMNKGVPSVVGEHGPELFVPSEGGRIMPATPSKRVMESTGSGIDPAQLEAILERVLAKAKPNVQMDVTNEEKVDPHHLAQQLAWSLT